MSTLGEGDCARAHGRRRPPRRRCWRGASSRYHEAEWLEEPRRQLENLWLEALECVGDAALWLGGHALVDAQRAAAALIAAAPYRESGYALKMRALAAAGNVEEAVRAYHDLRTTLDEELGMLPAPEVRELANRLIAGGAASPTDASERVEPVTIAPPRFATRTHARFVGRRRELDRLLALLDTARRGRRQLILLKGEPGIGKIRLAEQFTACCRRTGVNILAGRCDAEALMPYQPFMQALRPYVAAVGAQALRDRLGHLAQVLACVLPDLGSDAIAAEDGGDAAERFRLFEAVCALLSEITGTAPAALILDDLHWADAPTLQLLRHVVRAEEETPLLILGI